MRSESHNLYIQLEQNTAQAHNKPAKCPKDDVASTAQHTHAQIHCFIAWYAIERILCKMRSIWRRIYFRIWLVTV